MVAVGSSLADRFPPADGRALRPPLPGGGGELSVRRYDLDMAVTTPPKLDAHALRSDFAVFDDLVDGKPLAYLDSASSTQKPRQVLDAMREFYEHSYANVHRGVYRLAERATEGYEGARRKVAAYLNAPSASEVIFTRSATEAINLVAYAWGLENLGPGDVVVVTELEHHANFVPWQFIASRTGASFRHIPMDDVGRAASRCARRAHARGEHQGRRERARLQLAGDGEPRRAAGGVGARAGRDHGRRRRTGCTAPARRRAGPGVRLRGDLVAQALRAQRRRRAVGAPRAARGDGAVQPRRRDDPLGRSRTDDVQRASRTSSRRAPPRSPSRTGSAARSTTSTGSVSTRSRPMSTS